MVLSNSPGPETLTELVDRLRPPARAAGAAEAAAGDIVGVTVPLKASRPVPVEPLRGKPVIDINNYYPDRDGHIAELDDESTTVTEALVSLLRPAAGPSPGVARGKAFKPLRHPPRHLAAPGRSLGAFRASHRRRRRRGQAGGDRLPGLDRVRRLGRRPALRRLALPARHRRLRPALRRPRIDVPHLAGRQVTAEMLKEKLGAAVRYRDL